MKSLSFTVPLIPPSVNHYWTGQGKYTRVSEAGQAFKAAIAIFATGQTVMFYRLSAETEKSYMARLRRLKYSVTMRVVLGKGARGDVDNCWKGVLDGLVEAGVIHSDDRVLEVHGYKDPDSRPAESYTEITVEVL